MTKTKQATKSVKPAPVELHDETLDRVFGGGSLADGRYVLTALASQPQSATYPGGINVALGDGSVRIVN